MVARVTPPTAHLLARVLAVITWLLFLSLLILSAPLMRQSQAREGYGPRLAMIVILACVPAVVAAIGLWLGRRWGWRIALGYAGFAFMAFRSPSGMLLWGALVVFLLWIQPSYFELSSRPTKAT